MTGDPEMKAFADDEASAARARIEALEADLQRLLLPVDPDDERNVFLEIRAGTGGDESALFAGNLFRMYTRFAERNRWQVELVSRIAGRDGRLQGSDRAHRRQGRVLEAQVRVGRPSRAARARPPRRRGASTPRPARWR